MGNSSVTTKDIERVAERTQRNKKLLENVNPFEDNEIILDALMAKKKVARKKKI